MKRIGLVLAAFGLLALVYGGITYSREGSILDVGPFHATATEQRNVPFLAIVGGITLLGGVLLLVVPRKRLA